MVPGSAPALGCRRVRLAPDLSKQPPACGRIFFNSAREGACWCTRGRVRSPGPRRCRAIFCGAAASIPVAELGTSFNGAWHGLASCSRNSKCRAFRVGRADSISRRVRMSEGRVSAPPLTHFRGKAAIASKGNAALWLSLGTPTARHPYPELRERRSREARWRIPPKNDFAVHNVICPLLGTHRQPLQDPHSSSLFVKHPNAVRW